MNRVYKVIWSKAKHCYVVTSEIAKSHTKGESTGRGLKKLAAALLVAAALMGPNFAWAADDMATVKDTNGVDQIVYTVEGAERKLATKAELNAKANAVDVASTYVKNDDAKVGAKVTYVNAANTVGQNLSALDTNLSALDAQVKKNTLAVAEVVEAGEKVGEKLLDLDKQIKVNAKDNLKVGDDGGISKVSNDGTTSSPVNKLVLNVDGNNRITMDGNGIKVGTNSTVIASDGVFAGGDTAADAKAALNANGSIKGASGKFTVDGATGNVEAYGTLNVADGKFSVGSDGQLSASNGSFKVDTNGGINIGNGTAIIDNNGNITGKKLDVGTGDIKGGKITGAELDVGAGAIKGGQITGTWLETGTLKTTVSAEIGGTLKAGETTVKSLDAGSGLIKTDGTVKAGDVQTGTLTTTGNVTIGGALTVTGKLNMDEIDMTKNGIVDDNNVTASTKVAAGEITSYKKATSTKAGGGEKESAIDYDEKGTSTWAKATDADGKWNKSSLTVEGKGIKSIATDGKNNASTNLSNNGFNTFASDGTNKTYTKQTATDIKNTAEKGMISHTAKNLVNRAYENMTNTVDKDLTTTVGGNKSETVTGTSTETVTGKKTENYNGGLETTVTGEEKHTVNGSQINAITGSQTNTIGGNLTTTVTGDSSLTAENITNEAKNKITNKAIDVETDATSSIVQKVTNDAGSNTSTQWSYQTLEEMSQANGKTASYLRGAAEEKSQLTDGDKKTTIDTIAGQTNTNITEGKNVSNSLQKADQIASSVTDGTNTTVVNQDARSLASSITDGTGTKVNNSFHWVDGSAQRIEVDDTHFYAETRTAETAVETLKSGKTQINIVKDTNTATVSSAVTDYETITGISQNAKDINLSAAGGTIASGAKNITNTATVKLSNSAADIENTATTSITDKVGDNTSWKMTDGTVVKSVKDASGKTNQTTTTAADTYQFVKDGDNTLAKITSSTNDNLNITDSNNTYTKITTATGNKQTVTDGTETASTNLTKAASNTLIENGTQSVLDHMAADTSYTVMNENGNGSRRQQTASEILDRVTDGTDTSEVKQTASEVAASAKNISNTATDKITSQIGDGSAVKSEMTAKGITNTAKDGTITNDAKDLVNTASNSITDKVGENVERTMGTKQIQDKVGKTTVTTTDGLTELTNKDRNHKTVMDYANVTKDLNVNGDATVDQKLTVKGDSDLQGNATVGKNLEVKGTSTLKGDVTMESNATVTKDLTVKGASEFVGRADFRNDVYVDNNLFVEGETRTGTLYVDHDGYVDGDLYVAGNIETHDAELSENSRQVVTGRQLYQTNERVDRLDNRIKKVGANAAALAALRPGDFNPDDKFSIAAGFGSYRNANAAALGLFYRPNENVLLSLGTSFGDGENMVNAGVSVKFGRGKSMAERRKEMADEVSSMRDEMRSQDERIAELEEMLKKQSELIEKLSKES